MKEVWFGNQPAQVKAIGFDKDGTLFDALSFWLHVDQLRKSEFVQLAGSENESEWSQVMGFEHPKDIDYNGVLATATTQEEITLVAGALYRIKKWPWTECRTKAEGIFAAADKKVNFEEAFCVREGVTDLFCRLKEEGFSIGILTSDNYPRTESCMKLVNAYELMDFIITPEKVKKGKPYPDMVELTCEILGIQPQELAVVGDSIVDMRLAKSAGCLAVGLVTHPGSEELLEQEADILIHDIREIRLF